MVKVKLRRTIDALVGGYRWHKEGDRVGSLLLGLYDGEGRMHFVGHTASFSDADRRALLDRVRPLEVTQEEGFGDARRPGEPSRWDNERTLDWVALRPELVCEVSVDQFTGHRFRHAARFERWRPDKEADPADCPLSQIEPPPGPAFADLVDGAEGVDVLMESIATLTLNPAVDVSLDVEHVTPDDKLRTGPAQREPGGGGLNVCCRCWTGWARRRRRSSRSAGTPGRCWTTSCDNVGSGSRR